MKISLSGDFGFSTTSVIVSYMKARSFRRQLVVVLAAMMFASTASRCIDFPDMAATVQEMFAGDMPMQCDGCDKRAKISDACPAFCVTAAGVVPDGGPVLHVPAKLAVALVPPTGLPGHTDPPIPRPPTHHPLS